MDLNHGLLGVVNIRESNQTGAPFFHVKWIILRKWDSTTIGICHLCRLLLPQLLFREQLMPYQQLLTCCGDFGPEMRNDMVEP